jgi:hypothetical protein
LENLLELIRAVFGAAFFFSVAFSKTHPNPPEPTQTDPPT